jgi:hypothetical protein
MLSHVVALQMRDTLEQLRFVEPPLAILCRREMRPLLSSQQTRQIAADRRVSIVRGTVVNLSTTELPGEEEWLEVAQGAPTRLGSALPLAGVPEEGVVQGEAEPTSWLPRHFYSSPSGSRSALSTSGHPSIAHVHVLHVVQAPTWWHFAACATWSRASLQI